MCPSLAIRSREGSRLAGVERKRPSTPPLLPLPPPPPPLLPTPPPPPTPPFARLGPALGLPPPLVPLLLAPPPLLAARLRPDAGRLGGGGVARMPPEVSRPDDDCAHRGIRRNSAARRTQKYNQKGRHQRALEEGGSN